MSTPNKGSKEIINFESIDWTPLAAVMDERKLDALQTIMLGNCGIASNVVFAALGLNTIQWDALMRHPIYSKFIMRLLGQNHVGIIHLDKSQLSSIKLFLDMKRSESREPKDATIEVE